MPQKCKLLPDKGYERLERYEGKLSRTVLRRGRASNRSSLFGHHICFNLEYTNRNLCQLTGKL
jgi:hypothetical protein